ncbi:MAG: ATP-binding cassette domain-containing protein [Dehalococcoidia bacterium]|nr:ATP-binding cassette domain-containing protein [Dehalococcoidia bacterium]
MTQSESRVEAGAVGAVAVEAPARSQNGTGTILSIQNISKTFYPKTRNSAPVTALQDVSVEVARGEFISLVGPSGCGKSTLLNMVGGLIKIQDGKIFHNGTQITGPREDIGMMFQSPVLFPWRTVLSNVLLPIEMAHKPIKKYEPQAREILGRVGLGEFVKHYPGELSGGMQQRASLSRLLLQDVEVMLLDEPFGALDEFTREAMNIDLLRLWAGSGKTILFVTHNIHEAVFLSDRICVMTPRPGQLAEVIQDDLPRPREIGLMKTPEFQDLVFRVRTLLGVA